MRRAALYLLAALAGLAAPLGAAAQDPFQVRAFVQPNQGVTDTTPVLLVVQVEGTASPQLVMPRLDGLRNLQVVRGPETRMSSVWTNGRLASTYQLQWTLLPQGPGQAGVPAFEITIGGRTYKTDPIELDVASGGTGRAGSRPAPAPGGTAPQPAAADRADVFLEARLASREVWVGEPVALSVTLYANERLSSIGWSGQPDLDEFFVEDLDVDPDSERFRTTVDGRPYDAYPLVRKILVPQTAGSFDMEPYVLQLQVRLGRGNDPFNMFNFGRMQQIVRKTDTLRLTAKALPEQGRPEGFTGAVGSYQLRVALDRQEAQVNDAVALRAVVEGQGFLRTASDPLFPAPPSLKVLDPKISDTFRIEQGEMMARKTWEWIVVPLTAGELALPELRFPYFDPSSGSYRVAQATGPLLAVRRGSEAPEGAVHGDLRLTQRDIAFIKPLRGSLSEGAPRVYQRPAWWALMLLPLVWVPALIFVGRRRALLQRDRGFARARRARAYARKRLASTRRRMESLSSAMFHEEVARTLVEYVADRFDRSAAGLTYENVDDLLASRGVDAALRRRFRACLETCDFARFVPAAGKAERRTEVLGEATALVDELERAW